MTIISQQDVHDKIRHIKIFAKTMLKAQIFIGTFQEKRFVEPLGSYRDVVKIDDNEKEFIRNLKEVRKKVKDNMPPCDSNPFEPRWIGITTPNVIGAPVGYNLLVNLPIVVFGKYWFKVKTVEITHNEVRLKLDVIRSFRTEVSTVPIETTESFNIRKATQDSIQQLKSNIIFFYKNDLTLQNLSKCFIFIVVLISAICAGAFNIVHYLMEYFLKLMRELSFFVKVSTPIFISFINLLGKSITGLYQLILLLVHGKPEPAPVYTAYYNVNPVYEAIQNNPQNLEILRPSPRIRSIEY